MKIGLIPEVKELSLLDGSVVIGDYGLTKELKSFVPVPEELWREIGGAEGGKPVELNINGSCKEEEYFLIISRQNISVGASTPKGAYYALCTLAQLSLQNLGQLDCCEIHDWPDINVRGFSDDISRGQISTFENFKSIIRRLSEYKYNVYLPYIEDTFQYESLPESGKFSDPVRAEEWRELVAYAKEYHIKIVPIINLFGHWDKNSVLRAFTGDMLKEGDKPGGCPTGALDVRKPSVRAKVQKMLDEVTEVFGGSGVIHVGGDEVLELTKLFTKEESAAIYNGYYKYINDELRKRGLKMWMYSDMYTPVWGDYQLRLTDINEMPPEIGFVYWDYAVREKYTNIDDLLKRRERVYVSPATYSWSRFVPHYEVSWNNIKCLSGYRPDKCEGIFVSSWCDGGMNLREENWFGILAGAVFGWNTGSKMSFDEYIARFFEVYYGLAGVSTKMFHQMSDLHPYFISEAEKETLAGKPMHAKYHAMQAVGTRLYNEFWKDARLPSDEMLAAGAEEAYDGIAKAKAYFESLCPLRNTVTYQAMLFDLWRLSVNLKKVRLIKPKAYKSREEAMDDIPAILALADEVASLRGKNKSAWLATNRRSEWEFCESRYKDLEDSLRSLARYCKVAKVLGKEKYL